MRRRNSLNAAAADGEVSGEGFSVDRCDAVAGEEARTVAVRADSDVAYAVFDPFAFDTDSSGPVKLA